MCIRDSINAEYMTSDPIDNLPLILYFSILMTLGSVSNDKRMGLIRKNKLDPLEGNCLVIGSIAYLNQFHESNTNVFLGLFAQYIKSVVNFSAKNKMGNLAPENYIDVGNCLCFFEEFLRYSERLEDKAEPFIQLDLMNPLVRTN
eukprot:TRINITY_DN1491_c0_g1_i1.p1 TRINITY_DN1491_c0_g1~~TRINITY_DN1491_c0_g1_i1.p1  ORF type:complete len:166 (-),score=59.18 TRINITY_DN1491_c0_g1_i1:270-704(-)